MSGTILILGASTHLDDDIDGVVRLLDARGCRVVQLDSAAFPLDQRVSFDMDGGAWLSATGGAAERVDSASVSAVWYRHLDVSEGLRGRLDPLWHEAVAAQSERALLAFAASLPGLHVDHPRRADIVPGTPGILRLARAAGLDVPRTLVSNDPGAIRAFVAGCEAGAIRKMMHSSEVFVTHEDGSTHTGATEAVSVADLRDDARLLACPLIWQEAVPKARELRVTAVGRELFVASVDSRRSERGGVDWRQDPALVGGFEPDTLAAPVEAAVHRLLDRLALNFATLDIIRTPDGRHVVLEVNTTSYFSFVERATGLPIAAAVAGLLAGENAARVATDG